MAIATADQQTNGVQRGRGGFYRGANDVPWIADPSGATVKSGPRKGMPKRLAYGSPSNRGKQIENTTNLVKWGERRVVLGIGADPALVEMCAQLTALDVDSDDYKTLADSIIIAAKDAANASLAADRGTHGHALAEDHDGGHEWLRRAEDGEDLGLDVGVQAALVQAWREMLEANGLEVLAVEASCVDDTWRLAGTLDRIVRCTRALRFARAGGEITVVPAGTVLVLDVKTGRRRTDNRTGAPLYWQAYAIQIASYAQSVPYDTETETRGEWPWEIDRTHALIAHLDIEAALAGDAQCELVHVDLVAGREHGGECVVQAKAWEQRDDVFSVAQLEIAPGGEPASCCPGGIDVDTTGGPDLPPPAAPAPVASTPAEQHATVRARQDPAEGDPVDDGDFDAVQRHYRALNDEGRAWIEGLTRQAMQAGVSFHAKGNRTRRRYELIRALVILARQGSTDQDARDLLEPIIGDCAQFPAVTVGALVGSLSATEATTFAGLIDGRHAIHVREDGKPTLASAA
jgi:hypothetical protein